MKLNIGCGNRVKPNPPWVNIDIRERDHPLEYVIDITKKWPFAENIDFIYIEHFLEHLRLFEIQELLSKCYMSMRKGATLRIVVPHYKKIFEKYIEGDNEFFEPLFYALNNLDLPYYLTLLQNPEEIKTRTENIPPTWHFTDKERVRERCRSYTCLIEVVNYFTHQYGEHKTLLDSDFLTLLLIDMGFYRVFTSEFKEEYDSEAPTRKDFSLYMEAVK